MSVYTGVVFFRVEDDPDQLVMNLKRGVFFISVLNMTLINLGQLPGLLEERTIDPCLEISIRPWQKLLKHLLYI